jgi:subtilisin family serine protease
MKNKRFLVFKKIIFYYFQALCLVSVLLTAKAADAIKVKQATDSPGLSIKISKEGPLAKANNALTKLYLESKAHQQRTPGAPFTPSNPLLQFSFGQIAIDAVATKDGKTLMNDLKGLGLQRGVQFGSVVSGWLPLGAIQKMLALDSLQSAAASLRPLTNTGSVTSQGDIAMYADEARTICGGVCGTGITIGVLSDSFDQQGGASADQITGDLPSGVNVLDDTANCGSLIPAACSDEGRAMAQICYDVAPCSSIAFHTAFGGMANFAEGIVELANAGANVIVDDVIYFAEPMFQDGIIAQAVDQVVESGVAYFSSAGNYARKSYESEFVSSGEHLEVCNLFGCEDRGELHDFDPGQSTDWAQSITVPEGTTLILILQWNSFFGASLNDVDVYLFNGNVIYAESIADNLATGEPVETLVFPNNGYGTENFEILITHYTGQPVGLMKYVIFSSSVEIDEFTTDSSTLYGHANATGAEAVGAAYYMYTPPFGTNPPVLEPFSSAGGTPILFNLEGVSITPEIRAKPEVVAPDGVNTTFFYSDIVGNDGIPDFFGTSAAAPHAAGVAALQLEATGGALSPVDIYAAQENQAIDIGPSGFDYDSGYGLIKADLTVNAVCSSICGNGVKEGSEECDGSDFGSATCADYGYTGGTLTCNNLDCTMDFSNCTNYNLCDNDGFCEAGENCNNCPNDCRAKSNGAPNSRYCCDGDLPNCGDTRCSENGWLCGSGGTTCSIDSNNCDDGLFCNGVETCSGGICQPGFDPCPGQDCNEDRNQCVSVSCGGNKAPCSSGDDCCSGNCKNGSCKGN